MERQERKEAKATRIQSKYTEKTDRRDTLTRRHVVRIASSNSNLAYTDINKENGDAE